MAQYTNAKNMKLILAFLIVALPNILLGQNKFGWIGDSAGKPMPQFRSSQWNIKTPAAQSDLTKLLGPVLDQEDIGSCVAHGVHVGYNTVYRKYTGKNIELSRLQIYYDARVKIGMARVDSGSQIVDAVANLQKIGGAKERLWPYKTSKFSIKPTTKVYKDALNQIVIRAYKVDNTDGKSIRLALTNGYPVIVGSLVYSGINKITSSRYILEMPRRGERPVGGHCYIISGHNDSQRLYRGRNSWSEDWGLDGDFLLPYDYIHSGRITEDCWVIVDVAK
jgi:C1A family cysteine protease